MMKQTEPIVTQAEVVRHGLLDMQVCVPKDWHDGLVVDFAESECPCGTTGGWAIRTDEESLAGCPVRNPCSKREGMVHVTLDA